MKKFEIISNDIIAKDISRMSIFAPLIALASRAGQFVVLMISEKGERIPLTIAQTGHENVVLIYQVVGKTTMELSTLKPGDHLEVLLGPLGVPTEIHNYGRVITIGGGVGVAEVYPVTRALKLAGNNVISIIGARSKEYLILEKELSSCTDMLYITTDDGSYGIKGNVVDVLKDLILRNTAEFIYAIGPVPMMSAVSNITKVYEIKTTVSLNPIMVDGTGMCGSCRITVDGRTRFSCVDGPEFDAHLVDWDELTKRLVLFAKEERLAMEHYCHRMNQVVRE
jgi:ferredoxin--NADP+ reductase